MDFLDRIKLRKKKRDLGLNSYVEDHHDLYSPSDLHFQPPAFTGSVLQLKEEDPPPSSSHPPPASSLPSHPSSHPPHPSSHPPPASSLPPHPSSHPPPSSSHPTPATSLPPHLSSHPTPPSSQPTLISGPKNLDGDIGASTSLGPLKRRSRLRKNLQETLRDPSALAYLLQYMDSRKVQYLVKFWLEAESFRVSTLSTVGFVKKSGPAEAAQNSIVEDMRGGGGSNGASGTPSSDSTLPSRCIREMTSQDAVNIFSRFFEKDSPNFIGVSDVLRKTVIDRICGEDGNLDPYCFTPAQDFVFQILEKRYFPEFLESVHYCKHQVDVLTENTDNLCLSDILFNDSSLSYFTEFLDREGVMGVLQFWLGAESFRADLVLRQGIYNAEDAQNDAMVFYDKYFSMQATNSLGFGEEIRIAVENHICREGGPLPGCFDYPQRKAWNILDETYLPKFLKSDLFFKYISDLKHTIYNSLELPDPERRGGGRRCTSVTGGSGSSGERSGGNRSLQNFSRFKISSLLAQESPQAQARRRQMSFDSHNSNTSLEAASVDPKMLFNDKQKYGLSLGRINSLGHYVSDVHHPEPDSKGKMLADKVSKFIPIKNPEEEAKLAALEAERIIEGVRAMTTLSDDDDS